MLRGRGWSHRAQVSHHQEVTLPDDCCRSRFLPVKKTSDLLLLMSNLYTCAEHGQLRMSAR